MYCRVSVTSWKACSVGQMHPRKARLIREEFEADRRICRMCVSLDC